MKDIREKFYSTELVGNNAVLKEADMIGRNLHSWAKMEEKDKPLAQDTLDKLKALLEQLRRVYNTILELSQQPSLDRRAELLQKHKKLLRISKIVKILNDKNFHELDQELDRLDELDSLIENKLKSYAKKDPEKPAPLHEKKP